MSNVIMCSECKKCDGDRCNYFDNDSDRESTIACILFEPKQPTVFDRITANEETLAEKLVYRQVSTVFIGEWRSVILPAHIYGCFRTKEEAIAATVAKLKEVEK